MADMIDTSTEAVKALMNGVTPGKAVQFHPSYCKEAKGVAFSDWDTSHHVSVIRSDDGSRYRIAEFRHASEAAFHQSARDLVPALLAERDALRDKLAEVRTRADRAEAIAAEISRMATELQVERDAASARADRAEAALAAQIEADAGVATEEAKYQQDVAVTQMLKGIPWQSADWAFRKLTEVATAIRAQPHDRTALDRMLRTEREKALRDAADKTLGLATGHECRRAILAMIDKEDTP